MTDDQACELLRRAVAPVDTTEQHVRGDGILRRILREQGFPKLAKLHAEMAKDWWYE